MTQEIKILKEGLEKLADLWERFSKEEFSNEYIASEEYQTHIRSK